MNQEQTETYNEALSKARDKQIKVCSELEKRIKALEDELTVEQSILEDLILDTVVTKGVFSSTQQSYIDKCKSNGFGWKKFAESVEKQGSCSPKQEATLYRMCLQISQNKAKVERSKGYVRSSGKSSYRRHDTSISDNEAMRSGDFF